MLVAEGLVLVEVAMELQGFRIRGFCFFGHSQTLNPKLFGLQWSPQATLRARVLGLLHHAGSERSNQQTEKGVQKKLFGIGSGV